MKKRAWTIEEYKEYLRTGKMPNDYHVAVSAANLEPNIGNEFAGADAIKKIDAPVIITIYSKRKRLPDADGICAKYVIDALIGTILHDDSPQYVKEVRFRTEKCGKGEAEQTQIIISLAD